MVVPGEDDPVRVSVFCWRNSYFSALKLNVWIGIPDSAHKFNPEEMGAIYSVLAGTSFTCDS